jgi:hypothetical protein
MAIRRGASAAANLCRTSPNQTARRQAFQAREPERGLAPVAAAPQTRQKPTLRGHILITILIVMYITSAGYQLREDETSTACYWAGKNRFQDRWCHGKPATGNAAGRLSGRR